MSTSSERAADASARVQICTSVKDDVRLEFEGIAREQGLSVAALLRMAVMKTVRENKRERAMGAHIFGDL